MIFTRWQLRVGISNSEIKSGIEKITARISRVDVLDNFWGSLETPIMKSGCWIDEFGEFSLEDLM